jgi:hypothetical protein
MERQQVFAELSAMSVFGAAARAKITTAIRALDPEVGGDGHG